MKQDILLLLPIFLPIAGGVLELFIPKMKMKRNSNLLMIAAFLLVEFLLVVALAFCGDSVFTMMTLTDNLVLEFKVDNIARFFSVLSSLAWLLVGIFAFEYMKHEEDEERFFGFYLMVIGVLVALAYSDNMITYYVFFEAMTLASLPLVLHELHKAAIMAGLKYLFYSIAGAFMALFGIFFVASFGGAGTFAPGGILDATKVSGHETLLLVSTFLMIVGFGTKAGMFPMHGWLPTAHPEAPAPASAVLSGVITKMGVLAIIRVVYFVVGPEYIRNTWVQYAWLGLALTTVFMGSMLAYREKVMKKRLAYSTVSQVSYILFGLALLNKTAFIGAMLHVIFHSMVKNTLFCGAGAIIYKTHKTLVKDLKAIGKEMPITIWCFTLVSITLVGIPPTSGFVSKWFLATGALESGASFFAWLGPVVLLISALLTAGYLLTITIMGFFPGKDFDYATLEKREPNCFMTVPMLIMTTVAVVAGMFPAPLVAFAQSIAELVL